MNETGSGQLSSKYELWLRWLLAIIGCGLMVATIPIFFPVPLMATIHGWLGLGEFPRSANYGLSRSINVVVVRGARLADVVCLV